MKIRPVAVELLFVDRRTDITRLIVSFRNFANAPKMPRKKACIFRRFRMFFIVLKLLMFCNIICKVIIHGDSPLPLPAVAYREAIERAIKITINAEFRVVR